MKRSFFTGILVLFGMLSVRSQGISRNALGLRFGDSNGIGVEISYQLEITNATRIEMDLGFRNGSDREAVKLTGLYHWVWYLSQGLNWYAGMGAGIGFWNLENTTQSSKDGVFINADGNIGIEYDFRIPLMIALDFRPEFEILGDYSETELNLAFSMRYQF